jgi:hypothetical protein
MSDLLGKLEACDHHDAVRVLLVELGRRPKRALAALLLSTAAPPFLKPA